MSDEKYDSFMRFQAVASFAGAQYAVERIREMLAAKPDIRGADVLALFEAEAASFKAEGDRLDALAPPRRRRR